MRLKLGGTTSSMSTYRYGYYSRSTRAAVSWKSFGFSAPSRPSFGRPQPLRRISLSALSALRAEPTSHVCRAIHRSIDRAIPRAASCTAWWTSIWTRSSMRPRITPTVPACQNSWSRSSAASSCAACWRTASPASGAVIAHSSVIQRFGGGLNLNVHFHTLVLDGVFFTDGEGETLRFRPTPPPTDEEVGIVVDSIFLTIDDHASARTTQQQDDGADRV